MIMKNKLSLLLLMIVVVIAACDKKPEPTPEPIPETTPFDNLNPQQKNWAIVYNYTASWCHYCGEWGVATLRECVDNGNCVGLALKASGDPQAIPDGLYQSFLSDRTNNGSVPSFSVGDNVDVNSSAPNYCPSLQNRPCYLGLDVAQEIKDGKLYVYVKTKNFESLLNIQDYYMVAYLMEDGLHYEQTGSSDPDPVHNFVLRKASSGDVYYGEQLFTDGENGAELNHTFTFNLEPNYVASNCYAAVVIYKKKASGTPQYSYVNSRWTRR